MFKESEVLKQVLEILNIDCMKDNAISIGIRFDKIIKQVAWLIKKSVNRSEMPYFVLDGHKGVFFGIVSKSTHKWLKYVFFRLIRIFASNILRRNEGERFLIVGKCLNTHKMKSDFRFSGKEANLTLTVIKDKEVSKFYLKNRGIYENDRLDTIAGIQKKTSELLLELKERLNVPYIFYTDNGKNYYEVTFQKVHRIPSKYKINLITALNYSKVLGRVLDQCTTSSEKDALALDIHVNSYITCIKNKNIRERLGAESKGWLEDLNGSRHKLQVSHGDFWTENLIMGESTVWAIDFDRMSVLPKWYDAVHYIIQLSALVYKGITGWFDEITKTENTEQFYTKLLSRQDHDFRYAVKSFVRKNNILYEELLLAEIWVYRLITIYIASMNRKGVGDEAKIIKFIKIINEVESSKKGLIYKIIV